ncbi:MAG: sxtJ [Deltaproteobacteria bacterium]|nr:sxtJ [Deltaproteobacteria bacterium]
MHQSSRDLRKFGVTVGLAFLVLGAVSRWRGHELPPRVLWTLAMLLLVPGLVAPALLGPVQRAWMAAAEVMASFNTRLILGLLFYVVFTPVGLVMRIFRDPMTRSMRDTKRSHWIRRKLEPVDRARYEQQF